MPPERRTIASAATRLPAAHTDLDISAEETAAIERSCSVTAPSMSRRRLVTEMAKLQARPSADRGLRRDREFKALHGAATV
jgi:tRNA nucleotidyltransferase/poly(A) polymerase